MPPMNLGLIITGGVILLNAVIFTLVFTLIKKGLERQRRELEIEGVVLDSGPVWITRRLRGYSGHGMYAGYSVKKGRSHLVLTRTHLVALGFRGARFERSELHRFKVSVDDGALRLHTENPPGATGSMELRVPVADAFAWVRALKEAGAVEAS